MRINHLFFVFALVSSILTYGQITNAEKIISDNDKKPKIKVVQYGKRMAAWDLGSFYTPLLSRNFFGFNTDFKYYWAKRFSTGINWSIATKKIQENYSYPISKPIIYYDELGVINEFEFLQLDKIRANVSVNNGLSNPYLGDNAVKVHTGTPNNGYTLPKKAVSNIYYMFEPGLSLSVRLEDEIYLTLKGKYRFVYGKTNFGSIDQFSNYYIGIGFSVIGATN